MRHLFAALLLVAASAAQKWQDTCGRTPAGAVALRQALLDVGTDALVLLVASHPDDRYVLPAAWLRYCHGVRIAVLLATRGGGGQNATGPETGDELERIRTLETEAGCTHFDGEVWYLNRPDAGYRRSAAETFAEWGREQTLRDLVRLLRRIRPDCVVTTHHAEESHGHDLALVDLLPGAVDLAASPDFVTDQAPFHVRGLFLGAGSTIDASTVRVEGDRLEPVRGLGLRQLAYRILHDAHLSPGLPAPIDTVFEPELRLQPRTTTPSSAQGHLPLGLPSVFEPDIWPGNVDRARELEGMLSRLKDSANGVAPTAEAAKQATLELRKEIAQLGSPVPEALRDARDRLRRRLAAAERLLLLTANAQIELDVPPGTVAVGGEELLVNVRIHSASDTPVPIRVDGLGGVIAKFEAVEEGEARGGFRNGARAQIAIRIPLGDQDGSDPMIRAFSGDRFDPPVRLRFTLRIADIEVPVDLTVPVEQRAPVELALVPRMLLLPSARREVQFSVGVTRRTRFPVIGPLEVRAPAGYVVAPDHRDVSLTDVRGDLFGFAVTVPPDRTTGVDTLRIRLGSVKVALPVHTVDAKVPDGLRVGLLRGRDDTLPGILGVGGFGLRWSDLSDADIAVADLREFDTIVVDVRALHERPAARRAFRRLIDFAARRGHRLVVFYQKDVEFHPSGEGFLGAPFQPFLIGRSRVTRADAPVQVLRPDHVLLNRPNRILPGDWDGWDQERALYLPSVYASSYEEILAMNDPGQPGERGTLLYARTGEGEYVYCALALWRQLKKLHPGAVRLLANLLTPSSGS